ncbi:hypothetical protein TrVE_jg8594 [Triparma verrucosa]|uniref:UmuC domain-containing protein n=1 Tax=Triparma verrucosa TaxID=1606542 RepID=A0A9W7KU30_9STRA|nr:hypothetical protein TrVE_jg8594 [Triparma verrucosa]
MDEYNIDVSNAVNSGVGALELANELRKFVFSRTRFTTSVGAGPNIFLAKMAANEKKPYGSFHMSLEEARPRILEMPLRSLPGLGRASLNVMKEQIQKANFPPGTAEEAKLIVKHLLNTSTDALCDDQDTGLLSRADVEKFKEMGRGLDRRPVEDDEFKDKKRSGIEQSFIRGTLKDSKSVKAEISTLSGRLLKLIAEENSRFKGDARVGKNLVVTIRDRGEDGKSSYSASRKSKSVPWPGCNRDQLTLAASRLFELLAKSHYGSDKEFNITLINLAIEWADSGAAKAKKRGIQDIAGFFTAASSNPAKKI